MPYLALSPSPFPFTTITRSLWMFMNRAHSSIWCWVDGLTKLARSGKTEDTDINQTSDDIVAVFGQVCGDFRSSYFDHSRLVRRTVPRDLVGRLDFFGVGAKPLGTPPLYSVSLWKFRLRILDRRNGSPFRRSRRSDWSL